MFRVRVSPSVPQELYTLFSDFPRPGVSGASHVLRRLSSCMPRPEDAGGPPPPHHVGGIVLPSGAFKPSASAIAMSKLYQHFRVRGHPCGLQDSLSTLRPSCSPCLHGSAMDARLATGGWLALTRQGLSPCKRRQAFLGAITPGLSCCRKPERSVGCRQSAPGPCSARSR